jgi:hypothetical protein
MDSPIELRARESSPEDGVECPGSPAPHEARHEFPALPPVDGGKDAWLFLAACFVIEALIWGASYSSLSHHGTTF